MTFRQYSKEIGWIENEEYYTTAREIVNQIMCNIRDLLISTEKYFMQFLEYLVGSTIHPDTLTEAKIKKTRKIQRKLVNVPDSQLKSYLESKKK